MLKCSPKVILTNENSPLCFNENDQQCNFESFLNENLLNELSVIDKNMDRKPKKPLQIIFFTIIELTVSTSEVVKASNYLKFVFRI